MGKRNFLTHQDIANWSNTGLDERMIELIPDVAGDTVSQDGR